MGLYDFQKNVFDLISAGQSVILQAPTGAGKTRAALYPFFRAWEYQTPFPRKCVYSVPLRVLANQFNDEYAERAKNFGFVKTLHVGIQTGTQPIDPKLEDNLIFTTIDQTLSNFLNIPYALSLRQGNLNAGAILSSYLVFDELHLFDPETTLPTTLHLLKLLRNIVPVMVMTATLSEEMVKALAKHIGAQPLILTSSEAAAIPSQNKTRRIHVQEDILTPEYVLKSHKQRSIAICNTVDRAQKLFEGIRDQTGRDIEVRLLHSRFLPKDRAATEKWLRREFGKDKTKYTVEDAILISTQVIEVGVDITSQTLHTELAPAASVIQRAGRCARNKGEVGDVFVYELPRDNKGRPRYAPYLQKTEKWIIDLTWEELQQRSGQVFDFGAELELVNKAHQEADKEILSKLTAQRHYVAGRIADTIEAQERGSASELIREVDSRTVIVHPDPKAIDNPWKYEGFGIYRGSLLGAYEPLDTLASDLGIEWVMMTADPKPEDPDESRSKTIYTWRHIVDKNDLAGSILVAVNPALIHYSSRTGFQMAEAGDPTWTSPLRTKKRHHDSFPPYRRETLTEHVTRMMNVCEYPFFDLSNGKVRLPLFEELTYAARRLEQQQNWPEGKIEQVIRMVIAVHDLGKLDCRWQEWAHVWQEKVSRLRDIDLTIPDNYMAAHTDYDSQNDIEKAANRSMKLKRPNHAAESAAAAMDWLLNQVGDQVLVRAALTSIVRHHNAGAIGLTGHYKAHPEAQAAFVEILAEFCIPIHTADEVNWCFPANEALINRMTRPRRELELLTYLLMVRILRLADQRSQEWKQ